MKLQRLGEFMDSRRREIHDRLSGYVAAIEEIVYGKDNIFLIGFVSPGRQSKRINFHIFKQSILVTGDYGVAFYQIPFAFFSFTKDVSFSLFYSRIKSRPVESSGWDSDSARANLVEDVAQYLADLQEPEVTIDDVQKYLDRDFRDDNPLYAVATRELWQRWLERNPENPFCSDPGLGVGVDLLCQTHYEALYLAVCQLNSKVALDEVNEGD